MQLNIDIGPRLRTLLERFLEKWLGRRQPVTLIGARFMYKVQADHPNVEYSIPDFQVLDSEGNVLDLNASSDEITVQVDSSDGDVVAVLDATETTGELAFGSPGTAAVTCTVHGKNGRVLGTFGDVFLVTAGDPASIVGGGLQIRGLTPEPEVPVTPAEPPADDDEEEADETGEQQPV